MSASDHLRCVDETITPESSPLQENSGSCRTRPLAAQKRRLSIILDDETYGSQGPSTVSSQYDADNDGPRCALCIPPMSSCKDNSLNVCLDCLRSSSTPAKRARSDTDEPSLPSSGSIEPIFSLVVDEVDPALTHAATMDDPLAERFCVACTSPHLLKLSNEFLEMCVSLPLDETCKSLLVIVEEAVKYSPNLEQAFSKKVGPEHRFAALTALTQLNDRWGVAPETPMEAANISDRLVVAHTIDPQFYILAAYCSWFLVLKAHSKYDRAITLRELMSVAGASFDLPALFTVERAKMMESIICYCLDWHLQTPSVIKVLAHMLPCFTVDPASRHPMVDLAAEIALHTARSFAVYTYSLPVVALAIIRTLFDFFPDRLHNDHWVDGLFSISQLLAGSFRVSLVEIRNCTIVVQRELHACPHFQQFNHVVVYSPVTIPVTETFGCAYVNGNVV